MAGAQFNGSVGEVPCRVFIGDGDRILQTIIKDMGLATIPYDGYNGKGVWFVPMPRFVDYLETELWHLMINDVLSIDTPEECEDLADTLNLLGTLKRWSKDLNFF